MIQQSGHTRADRRQFVSQGEERTNSPARWGQTPGGFTRERSRRPVLVGLQLKIAKNLRINVPEPWRISLS